MAGYQELANAIVIQFAKDYKRTVRALKKNPRNQSALKAAMEIEGFFYSGWYETLTEVDADYLISRLRKEAVK